MTTQKIERSFRSGLQAKQLKGQLWRVDGALYRVINVAKLGPSLSHEGMTSAEIEVRPATEAEAEYFAAWKQLSDLQHQLSRGGLYINDNPADAIAVENRKRRVEINAEIAALEPKVAELKALTEAK